MVLMRVNAKIDFLSIRHVSAFIQRCAITQLTIRFSPCTGLAVLLH